MMKPTRPFPVFLLAALAGLTPLCGQAPKASVAENIWDAGVVAKGEKVLHHFEIRNGGDAPLEILEARPGCGCTVVEFDALVAPGKTGRVGVELDTTNFEGPISKYVTVYTSDNENPRLLLTVKADVQPIVAMRPGWARHIWVQNNPERPVEAQHVWATDGHPLVIRAVESPYPYLDVEFHRASQEERDPEGPDQQWIVQTRLKGDAPAGKLAGFAVLRTDHPQAAAVNLPISGEVKPRLAVRPSTIDFGRFSGDSETPRRAAVLITNYTDEPIVIRQADSTLAGLSASVREIAPGKRYQVTLEMAGELPPPGAFSAVVKVATDDALEPELEIEVEGEIAGS